MKGTRVIENKKGGEPEHAKEVAIFENLPKSPPVGSYGKDSENLIRQTS